MSPQELGSVRTDAQPARKVSVGTVQMSLCGITRGDWLATQQPRSKGNEAFECAQDSEDDAEAMPEGSGGEG